MPPTPAPRLLPLGDSAWTVELGQHIDDGTHARVMGLSTLIAEQRGQHPLLARVTDVVPTFRSLTVHFDAALTDAGALGAHLLALAQHAQGVHQTGRAWVLPVCFDDDLAPDLPQLCEARGLSRAAAIGLLLSVRLRVYQIGFQPGFAYMGSVPAALNMPRLSAPRQKVPAQSVAVAGAMCAIYPWESPGGWNLVGRTPLQLFDLRHAEQPAMLAAGDAVQWTAVDRATHDALAADVARGLPRETFLEAAGA